MTEHERYERAGEKSVDSSPKTDDQAVDGLLSSGIDSIRVSNSVKDDEVLGGCVEGKIVPGSAIRDRDDGLP